MKTRVEVMAALLVSAFILTLRPASAQTQTPPKSFDLIDWNGGKFVYGVDYYPEHWDESQWEKDATMMQAAGINFVRLAEFAWVKMEPVEGKFDFAWLDRALKVLNAHGIKAVLGTPTASPPAWLYAKYPDIAAMDENGVRYRYGSRRQLLPAQSQFPRRHAAHRHGHGEALQEPSRRHRLADRQRIRRSDLLRLLLPRGVPEVVPRQVQDPGGAEQGLGHDLLGAHLSRLE